MPNANGLLMLIVRLAQGVYFDHCLLASEPEYTALKPNSSCDLLPSASATDFTELTTHFNLRTASLMWIIPFLPKPRVNIVAVIE